MNPSNRTIEEKLAIVQQLRSNSTVKPTDKFHKTSKYISGTQNNPPQEQTEENTHFFVFLIIRIVICIIIFGLIAFMGSRNPELHRYINAMITTEENGNLIDFMSPFTYTLQESDESASETSEDGDINTDAPSVE